jgi:hypothetical protein
VPTEQVLAELAEIALKRGWSEADWTVANDAAEAAHLPLVEAVHRLLDRNERPTHIVALRMHQHAEDVRADLRIGNEPLLNFASVSLTTEERLLREEAFMHLGPETKK